MQYLTWSRAVNSISISSLDGSWMRCDAMPIAIASTIYHNLGIMLTASPFRWQWVVPSTHRVGTYSCPKSGDPFTGNHLSLAWTVFLVSRSRSSDMFALENPDGYGVKNCQLFRKCGYFGAYFQSRRWLLASWVVFTSRGCAPIQLMRDEVGGKKREGQHSLKIEPKIKLPQHIPTSYYWSDVSESQAEVCVLFGI